MPPRLAELYRLYEAVAQYQSSVRVLDILTPAQLRRPTEIPLRLDRLRRACAGTNIRPRLIQKLTDLGWLEGDHWGRLVVHERACRAAEWRRVQAAGVINSVFCPERLLDDPKGMAAMSRGGRRRLVRSGPERRRW